MPAPPGETVVTLDIGGSGLKLLAYDVSAHHSVATRTQPWPADSWAPDGSEFDVGSWWATTVAALADFVAGPVAATAVAAVTVAAIRIPFVLTDAEGEPVTTCLSNGDRRAVAEAAEIETTLGAHAVYELTGHWPTAEFALPKLVWLSRHRSEAVARTRHLLQLHDWFVFKLCGTMASEPSAAAMSQFLEIGGARWATELLDSFGLPTCWLPELAKAGARAGGLLPDVAARTGLAAGTPVHLGGGDTQMSALGAGALNAIGTPGPRAVGPTVVVAGTTAPVQQARRGTIGPAPWPLLPSRQLLADWTALEVNAAGVGGPLHSLAATASAATRDPADTAIQGFRRVEPDAPELEVLIGNPIFGPGSWAHSPSGAIAGLRTGHTWEDVLLAGRRGSARAVDGVLGQLRSATGIRTPLVATGGLALDRRWVQMLADATDEAVRVPDPTSTAGIAGASVVTGDALWSKSDEATMVVYQPNPDTVNELRARKPVYDELCARVRMAALEAV